MLVTAATRFTPFSFIAVMMFSVPCKSWHGGVRSSGHDASLRRHDHDFNLSTLSQNTCFYTYVLQIHHVRGCASTDGRRGETGRGCLEQSARPVLHGASRQPRRRPRLLEQEPPIGGGAAARVAEGAAVKSDRLGVQRCSSSSFLHERNRFRVSDLRVQSIGSTPTARSFRARAYARGSTVCPLLQHSVPSLVELFHPSQCVTQTDSP